MSSADIQEPPRKKPRFFVEDLIEEASSQEAPVSTAIPEVQYNAGTDGIDSENSAGACSATGNNGFDVELLCSIIGEQLESSVLKQLQERSGNDLQQGNKITSCEKYRRNTNYLKL